MPFEKGNILAKKKTGIKHNTGIQEYLSKLATGTARIYYSNIDKLMQGEELPKPVKEGMDRFERNTEFIAPKLARTENKTEIEGDINFSWQQ